MYCFVKPICYWNEEQWQQVKVSGSLVFAGAIWEKFAISLLHLGNGPISSKQGHSGSCASILPRALLVTAAAPALERVQCGNVHVLVELVLHTSPAAGQYRSFQELQLPFLLQQNIIQGKCSITVWIQGYWARWSRSKGILTFLLMFKSTKIMYLMLISYRILMSGYLVPC